MSVAYVPGAPGGGVRVAFATSRQVGSAVARNRVRRRLRAAVREHSARLSPGAYLVASTAAGAEEPFDRLCAALGSALDALEARR